MDRTRKREPEEIIQKKKKYTCRNFDSEGSFETPKIYTAKALKCLRLRPLLEKRRKKKKNNK